MSLPVSRYAASRPLSARRAATYSASEIVPANILCISLECSMSFDRVNSRIPPPIPASHGRITPAKYTNRNTTPAIPAIHATNFNAFSHIGSLSSTKGISFRTPPASDFTRRALVSIDNADVWISVPNAEKGLSLVKGHLLAGRRQHRSVLANRVRLELDLLSSLADRLRVALAATQRHRKHDDQHHHQEQQHQRRLQSFPRVPRHHSPHKSSSSKSGSRTVFTIPDQSTLV